MTTTNHEARAADINAFAPTARAARIAEGMAAPTPKRTVARAYEGFLGLPVWAVLAAMWVGGAALLGSFALVTYVVGSVLLRALLGYF